MSHLRDCRKTYASITTDPWLGGQSGTVEPPKKSHAASLATLPDDILLAIGDHGGLFKLALALVKPIRGAEMRFDQVKLQHEIRQLPQLSGRDIVSFLEAHRGPLSSIERLDLTGLLFAEEERTSLLAFLSRSCPRLKPEAVTGWSLTSLPYLPVSGRLAPLPWTGDGSHSAACEAVAQYDLAFKSSAATHDRHWGRAPQEGLGRWIGAQMLYPEPADTHHNGVAFSAAQIKALLQLVHREAPCTVLGVLPALCGHVPHNPGRDLNPGIFHSLVTSCLGSQQRGLVLGIGGWPQAICGYVIRHMREVDLATANRILGVGNANYPYNNDARRWACVSMGVDRLHERRNPPGSYLVEEAYEYVLECDDRCEIIGGEWVGSSKTEHPTFAWVPQELFLVSSWGLDVDAVKSLSVGAAG